MIEICVVGRQWVTSWMRYTEKREDWNSAIFKDLRMKDIIGLMLTLYVHLEAQLLPVHEKCLSLETHRQYSRNENKKKKILKC